MTWDDVLLETVPDEDALRRALAAVFGVSLRSVGVVRSTEESTGSASVRAVMTPVRGDFACMVWVSVKNVPVDVDRVSGVARVCAALGTSAWITDGSDNPFAGLFIDATGMAQPTQLDPDAEERGEYRLWRSHP